MRATRDAISGSIMQTLSIVLEPGEAVVSQTHAMAWMTDAIDLDTHTSIGAVGLMRTRRHTMQSGL